MRLPEVLAGPILRRCDPNRVLVWMATSAPFQFKLEVSEVVASRSGPTLGPIPLSKRTESMSVQLGRNLYVHIVGAFPTGEPSGASRRTRVTERASPRLGQRFPTDVLLSYDVSDLGSSAELVGDGRTIPGDSPSRLRPASRRKSSRMPRSSGPGCRHAGRRREPRRRREDAGFLQDAGDVRGGSGHDRSRRGSRVAGGRSVRYKNRTWRNQHNG